MTAPLVSVITTACRVVTGSLSSKPKRSAAWVWNVYRRIEKLGPLHSAWCMAHYGARAVLKRLVF